MKQQSHAVYTIGHSTLAIASFVRNLILNEITALADVRSSPYSRFNPQFNREVLKNELNAQGIKYVFLGNELGARSDDPTCYDDGQVQYDRLAETNSFKNGIERVQSGASEYRIVLMCAEREPLDCHRTVLVARELEKHGIEIRHILSTSEVEPHEKAMDRLIAMLSLDNGDLFRSREEIKNAAYDKQAKAIAYSESDENGERTLTAGSRQ